MKIEAAALSALLFSACLGEADSWPTLPKTDADTIPDSPALKPIWVSGMVIGESGGCLPDATVQIVYGQGSGRSVMQTACNIWDESDGFVFDGLTAGAAITIRASVPGYRAVQLTVVPKAPQTERIIIMVEKL